MSVKPDDDRHVTDWQARAERSYLDERCEPRLCDRCGRSYRGPAIYCSLQCAVADA